jgi:hypothetical protein
VNKWVIGFVVWLVLVLGSAAYVWGLQQSEVGGGYVAKEVCSCMFVAGRDFAACRADLMERPGLDWVKAEPFPSGVRAGLPFFTPRVARAQPYRGCTLEP